MHTRALKLCTSFHGELLLYGSGMEVQEATGTLPAVDRFGDVTDGRTRLHWHLTGTYSVSAGQYSL